MGVSHWCGHFGTYGGNRNRPAVINRLSSWVRQIRQGVGSGIYSLAIFTDIDYVASIAILPKKGEVHPAHYHFCSNRRH